jgi:hypothetical protein
MLCALPAFHVLGLLGFRWLLLRHRALRDFSADTRHFPLGFGYEHSKTIEGCPGDKLSTTTHGRAHWVVCMLQRHWRMTINHFAQKRYILNGSWGVGDVRMLAASV